MKKYILIVCTFWVSALIPVMGQSFIFNGDTVKGSICMIDDSTRKDTMRIDAVTWAQAKDTTKHGWYTRGDVAITDTLDSVVYFTSTGPGKGGVYFTYGTRGCGDFVKGSEIYKDFSPDKYELAIQGSDCLKEGDTVVYSIDPIFTKNLGDFIGIDSYYWNINQESYLSFVKSIIYVSGDGSSVTFVAGNVTGNDSIVVNFGRCNQEESKRVVKYLGKAAPKPIVRDTCIPFDQTSLELNIFNEEYPDLVYTWDYNPKWNPASYPSLDDNSQKRYHVELYPDTGSVGVITVTASYGDDDPCASAGRTTFYLSRSWGKSAKITPQEVYAKNGGDFIKFQLSKDSVPDMSPTWELPTTGWEQKSGTSNHQFTYFARPTNTTQYIDTIEVWANTCNSKDSCLAIVHMAPAKVDSISELTCLVPGNTYTFRVERLEVGPRPTGYTWYINGDSVYTSEENTYTRSFTSNMTSIAVRSLGQNGWNADTTQIELSYRPTSPDSLSIDNLCLFTGENNKTKLTVHNRVSGMEYSWVYPENWTEIPNTRNDSSITLLTDGTGGEKRVGVYAMSQSHCGYSDTLYKILQIDTTSYKILYTEPFPGLNMFTLWDYILNQEASADWEINGEPQPFSANSTYTYRQNSIPDSVKAIVTRSSGCEKNVVWTKQEYFLQNQSQIRMKSEIKHKNISYQPNITLYPNPTKNVLTITKDDEQEYKIFIFDINGRLHTTFNMNKKMMKIDISHLSNGNYSVVFTDGISHIVKKIIINH